MPCKGSSGSSSGGGGGMAAPMESAEGNFKINPTDMSRLEDYAKTMYDRETKAREQLKKDILYHEKNGVNPKINPESVWSMTNYPGFGSEADYQEAVRNIIDGYDIDKILNSLQIYSEDNLITGNFPITGSTRKEFDSFSDQISREALKAIPGYPHIV
jgi:hypothetical protein